MPAFIFNRPMFNVEFLKILLTFDVMCLRIISISFFLQIFTFILNFRLGVGLLSSVPCFQRNYHDL